MSINATQSHSGEHLVAKKAVCYPEICLEKKKWKQRIFFRPDLHFYFNLQAPLQYTCVHVIRMFKISPTLTSTCEFKLDPKSFIVDVSEN